MPRIIEAKVGKVTGPLRMRVVPTASFSGSKAQTPKRAAHDHPPVASSNLEMRRGRYSRIVGGLKKSRSKSLPSSKQASLLFGKPPEDDDALLNVSADHSVERKKANKYKSQDLRVTTPRIVNGNIDVANNIDSNDFMHDDAELLSSMTSTESSQQRFALAIDTRCLSTSASTGRGSESFCVAQRVIQNCKHLTKSLHSRGITPCIVSSTTASDTSRLHLYSTHENKRVATALSDLGLGIETHKLVDGNNETLRKAMDNDDGTLYSQIEIASVKSNSGAISIPLPLHASYSWLLYSAMVDAIIAEDAKITGFVSSMSLKESKGPINVRIICSDVSLFCDTNVDSHRTGLQVFVDHVTPYFQRGLLCSIDITTAVTEGQLALSVEENEQRYLALGQSPDTTTKEQQQNHVKAMQECVRMIECTLDDSMVGIHSCHNDEMATSVCCSFTMIKNSIVDFMTLSHSLVRTALVGRSARLACRLRRIDLPVSDDGTHCSISLEGSYEIFPFMVHSHHAKFLSSDLDDLSYMNLEVVQSMPLSMIDVSLLFGIPLVVRAGLETDYAQFQDMKILVRSLFTVLQKQDMAMLLRGSSQCQSEKCSNANSGFSYPSEQYFVLMSQETPTSMMNTAIGSAGPNSGLLFRMAHCDYLLHDRYMMDSVQNQYQHAHDDLETEIQYMEYIENSLSTLSVGTYNPFTICLPNHGRRVEPAVLDNVGIDEGDIHTSDCLFDEKDASRPMEDLVSSLADTGIDTVSNEMDFTYDAASISIYDLHAITDDMSH